MHREVKTFLHMLKFYFVGKNNNEKLKTNLIKLVIRSAIILSQNVAVMSCFDARQMLCF